MALTKPITKRLTRSATASKIKINTASIAGQSGSINGPQTVLNRAMKFYEKLNEFDAQRNEIHKERQEIIKSLADSEVNLMMKIQRLRKIEKLQIDLQETTKMKDKLDQFEEERRICVICLCSEREYACVPCGHFAFCGDCIKNIRVCSVCNTAISDQIRIYMP